MDATEASPGSREMAFRPWWREHFAGSTPRQRPHRNDCGAARPSHSPSLTTTTTTTTTTLTPAELANPVLCSLAATRTPTRRRSLEALMTSPSDDDDGEDKDEYRRRASGVGGHDRPDGERVLYHLDRVAVDLWHTKKNAHTTRTPGASSSPPPHGARSAACSADVRIENSAVAQVPAEQPLTPESVFDPGDVSVPHALLTFTSCKCVIYCYDRGVAVNIVRPCDVMMVERCGAAVVVHSSAAAADSVTAPPPPPSRTLASARGAVTPCCWTALRVRCSNEADAEEVALGFEALKIRYLASPAKLPQHSEFERAVVLQHQARSHLALLGIRPEGVTEDLGWVKRQYKEVEELEAWKMRRLLRFQSSRELQRHKALLRGRSASSSRSSSRCSSQASGEGTDATILSVVDSSEDERRRSRSRSRSRGGRQSSTRSRRDASTPSHKRTTAAKQQDEPFPFYGLDAAPAPLPQRHFNSERRGPVLVDNAATPLGAATPPPPPPPALHDHHHLSSPGKKNAAEVATGGIRCRWCRKACLAEHEGRCALRLAECPHCKHSGMEFPPIFRANKMKAHLAVCESRAAAKAKKRAQSREGQAPHQPLLFYSDSASASSFLSHSPDRSALWSEAAAMGAQGVGEWVNNGRRQRQQHKDGFEGQLMASPSSVQPQMAQPLGPQPTPARDASKAAAPARPEGLVDDAQADFADAMSVRSDMRPSNADVPASSGGATCTPALAPCAPLVSSSNGGSGSSSGGATPTRSILRHHSSFDSGDGGGGDCPQQGAPVALPREAGWPRSRCGDADAEKSATSPPPPSPSPQPQQRCCPWCQKPAPPTHDVKCAKRRVVCRSCGLLVVLKDRVAHSESCSGASGAKRGGGT